jgi:hypothetical protein
MSHSSGSPFGTEPAPFGVPWTARVTEPPLAFLAPRYGCLTPFQQQVTWCSVDNRNLPF